MSEANLPQDETTLIESDVTEETGEFEEVLSSPERRRQNSRSFLVLLGSSLSIILLALFLKLELPSSTKLLILIATFMMILGIIIYMDRNNSPTMLPEQESDQPLEDIIPSPEISDQTPDSTDEDRPTLDQTQPAENISIIEEDEESAFAQLVREALDEIPVEFHHKMQNLIVMIEDEPTVETLQSTNTPPGSTLLGLYHGVPITAMGYQEALLPQRITIYQSTIERYCHYDPERIRAQVRATVLHEVAHHFGISHDDMPIWVR